MTLVGIEGAATQENQITDGHIREMALVRPLTRLVAKRDWYVYDIDEERPLSKRDNGLEGRLGLCFAIPFCGQIGNPMNKYVRNYRYCTMLSLRPPTRNLRRLGKCLAIGVLLSFFIPNCIAFFHYPSSANQMNFGTVYVDHGHDEAIVVYGYKCRLFHWIELSRYSPAALIVDSEDSVVDIQSATDPIVTNFIHSLDDRICVIEAGWPVRNAKVTAKLNPDTGIYSVPISMGIQSYPWNAFGGAFLLDQYVVKCAMVSVLYCTVSYAALVIVNVLLCAVRMARSRCACCGYDVSSSAQFLRCSECGTAMIGSRGVGLPPDS